MPIPQNVVTNLGAGTDLYLTSTAPRKKNGAFQEIIIGGADSDTVDGGNSGDTIYGGSDAVDPINDTVTAGADADSITGENDSLVGGNGNDTMRGGNGADTFVGGSGTDTIDCGEDDGDIEALLFDGTSGVTDANLTSASTVASLIIAEFDVTSASDDDVLVVVNATNSDRFSVWVWVDSGIGMAASGELTLLGVFTSNADAETLQFDFI